MMNLPALINIIIELNQIELNYMESTATGTHDWILNWLKAYRANNDNQVCNRFAMEMNEVNMLIRNACDKEFFIIILRAMSIVLSVARTIAKIIRFIFLFSVILTNFHPILICMSRTFRDLLKPRNHIQSVW